MENKRNGNENSQQNWNNFSFVFRFFFNTYSPDFLFLLSFVNVDQLIALWTINFRFMWSFNFFYPSYSPFYVIKAELNESLDGFCVMIAVGIWGAFLMLIWRLLWIFVGFFLLNFKENCLASNIKCGFFSFCGVVLLIWSSHFSSHSVMTSIKVFCGITLNGLSHNSKNTLFSKCWIS